LEIPKAGGGVKYASRLWYGMDIFWNRPVQQEREKLKHLQETLKSQESELRNVNSTLTTEDAKARLTELTNKCNRHQERIKNIKSATNHVTPEEKDKIYKEHKLFVQSWRKRKRMATDILNSILEGYPKPKKQLIEDVGIETDEEYGAEIPNL